jgi:hypothetical protein
MAAVEVTANAQQTLPTAATGVSVTPNATAWVNSAYTQLTASIGAAITIVGVMVDPGVAAEYEVDIARGNAASEVVVATAIGHCEASANSSSNHVCIFNVPIDDIASGQRIAVRMRKEGISTTAWTFKLLYYNSVASTMGVTANESLAVPSAAAGVSLTPSGTAWVNSAYGELSASLTDIVALGLAVNVAGGVFDFECELDIAAGGATSEVVKGTTGLSFTGSSLGGLLHLIEFRVPISIPGTNRIACRMRKNGTDTTAWTVKLLYISASGFGTSAIQYTSQPQKITPDAAALPTVAGNMTAWANSAYLQMIASTSTAIVLVSRTLDNDEDYQNETDVATGAATAEAVVSSVCDLRDSSQGANDTIPLYLALDNIATSTRVATRHRDSNASASTTGHGLTYYEKPL